MKVLWWTLFILGWWFLLALVAGIISGLVTGNYAAAGLLIFILAIFCPNFAKKRRQSHEA